MYNCNKVQSNMNSSGNNSNDYLEICSWENIESIVIIGFPSRKYYINLLVCFVMNIFLTIATILVNTVAIAVYLKSDNLKKRASCFLVMILSANDLATGMLATSTSAIDIGGELLNNVDCFTVFLNAMFLYLLIPISFSTLLMLNVERYLSIMYPILHKSKVTKTKLLLSLGLFWLSFGFVLYLFFVKKPLATLYLGIGNIAGLTMLLGMYTKIFFIIRRRGKEMISLGTTRGRENEKNFLQNVREAWSCLMVAIFTIVCFLPTGIEGLVGGITYSSIIQRRWNTTFLLIAPVLNFLVFIWRNKVWRNEAKKTLCKKL